MILATTTFEHGYTLLNGIHHVADIMFLGYTLQPPPS
jgi:hypothetical protein